VDAYISYASDVGEQEAGLVMTRYYVRQNKPMQRTAFGRR
jgi:hypothetical protein